jgi:hypothetical protein
MSDQRTERENMDDRVALPLDPEEALKALLSVDPAQDDESESDRTSAVSGAGTSDRRLSPALWS